VSSYARARYLAPGRNRELAVAHWRDGIRAGVIIGGWASSRAASSRASPLWSYLRWGWESLHFRVNTTGGGQFRKFCVPYEARRMNLAPYHLQGGEQAHRAVAGVINL